VKNTAQITKAMQMVAASKMRKAQQIAIATRPYAQELARMMLPFIENLGDEERAPHPLLDNREVSRELVLLISTDKGLCGALNTNLLRELSQFDPSKTDFVCVGKKGGQFLVRTKRTVLAEFELKDNFTYFDAQAVSRFCLEQYMSGKVDRITVLYTDFVNTLQQVPRTRSVAPVHSFEIGNVDLAKSDEPEAPPTYEGIAEYILEPNRHDLLDHLLPHFVFFKIYHLVLESRASEHSARMVAMKNATDNAKQLIKDLTLEYNKIRQAGITTEILEIATAQMVLS
jgi:F-type H+-transporting ATPase subunit gamma